MDYGNLLARSWSAVQNHRHMLALGVMAILAADAGIGGAGPITESLLDPNFDQMIRQQMVSPSGITPTEILVLAEVSKVFYVVMGFSWIVIGLLLWIGSRLAEGGLIASAQQIEQGQGSSFANSWVSGRAKLASLTATGLIFVVPMGLLSLANSIVTAVYSMPLTDQSLDATAAPNSQAVLVWLGFTCTILLLGAPLTLMRTLADRAVVLDGLPAGAAVRRGLRILRARPGQILLVGLIEIGTRVMVAIVVGGAAYCALIGLAVAGMAASGPQQGVVVAFLAAVCCLLPPLLAISGAMQSFFATLWTLAWREWTASEPVEVLTPNGAV